MQRADYWAHAFETDINSTRQQPKELKLWHFGWAPAFLG